MVCISDAGPLPVDLGHRHAAPLKPPDDVAAVDDDVDAGAVTEEPHARPPPGGAVEIAARPRSPHQQGDGVGLIPLLATPT